MGGVGPNFKWIANGPGYGAGTWEKPRGQYGVAQVSPWLLFPLDGLNLKQGTNGELFGYSWYRFVDQPSFRQYDWSAEKKAKLQSFVEKLHANWPIDRDYIAPPTHGKLVALDPALLVIPPKGLETGYVPIATRQEWGGAATQARGQ